MAHLGNHILASRPERIDSVLQTVQHLAPFGDGAAEPGIKIVGAVRQRIFSCIRPIRVGLVAPRLSEGVVLRLRNRPIRSTN
jgi:hypothetical protein